jgi:hypothetical protein
MTNTAGLPCDTCRRSVKTILHNVPPFFCLRDELFLVFLAPFFIRLLADTELEAGLLNLCFLLLKAPLSSLAFNKEGYNTLNTVKTYICRVVCGRRTYTSVERLIHTFFQTASASLLHASCYVSLCHIIIWPSTQHSPNDQTNIVLLTFVHYSVLVTCFSPARSSSCNFHDTPLTTGLCPNIH